MARKTIVRTAVTVGALLVGAVAILGLCSGVLSFFELDDALGGLTVIMLSDDRDDSPIIPVADAPTTGPSDAAVTIVVFGDYQDPYTREAYVALASLMAELPDDLRIVHRHFLLQGDERGLAAATAAIAAGRQGAFWAYHRKLLDAESLDDDALLAIAGQVELNVEVFDVARSDRWLEVDADIELGEQLGVRGTPTLFINGKKFEGVPEDLAGLVTAELAAADGQTYARRVEVNLGLVD